MANNRSNISLLPFKNNLVPLFSYLHTMNARHRSKKTYTKQKKPKNLYMKLGDKFDGPILLGKTRSGFKLEKSAERLMEECLWKLYWCLQVGAIP